MATFSSSAHPAAYDEHRLDGKVIFTCTVWQRFLIVKIYQTV